MMIFVSNGYQCLKMFDMFKIVEDMFECNMLQHACLNARDMFVAKTHLIIFSKYKGRDRENINLSLFGFNLIKQIFPASSRRIL